MNRYLKEICVSIVFALVLGVTFTFAAEELIPPTRTLEGRVELPGSLTVVSEPPDLDVSLDGSSIGRTPVWFKEVKPGPHTVRIGQEKTEVHVQPGKKMALSFFKDSFIDITKEEAVVEAPVPEVKKPGEKEGAARPPRPEEREDIIRFEQFINRNFDFF
ncbi:MAG: PEGA domain-containing protein [Nitrospiraceae bacterium]